MVSRGELWEYAGPEGEALFLVVSNDDHNKLPLSEVVALPVELLGDEDPTDLEIVVDPGDGTGYWTIRVDLPTPVLKSRLTRQATWVVGPHALRMVGKVLQGILRSPASTECRPPSTWGRVVMAPVPALPKDKKPFVEVSSPEYFEVHQGARSILCKLSSRVARGNDLVLPGDGGTVDPSSIQWMEGSLFVNMPLPGKTPRRLQAGSMGTLLKRVRKTLGCPA